MNDSICAQMIGPPPPIYAPCTLHCSDQCVLTEWTAWSSCPQTCNADGASSQWTSSSKYRSRTLAGIGVPRAGVPYSRGGIGLPDAGKMGVWPQTVSDCDGMQLVQEELCMTHSCSRYTWGTQEIGGEVCHNGTAGDNRIQCGTGFRRRSVKCFTAEGRVVHPSRYSCLFVGQ